MKNISNWDLVLSPMHLRHQTWPTGKKKKEKSKTAFSSVSKKKGDFWRENSISVISGTGSQFVFVFTDGRGDSNTQGKKVIRNNWKQLRLVEGKWVDRDEHFSMQPQKNMEYPREIKQVKKDMRPLSETALCRKVWFTFICPSSA